MRITTTMRGMRRLWLLVLALVASVIPLAPASAASGRVLAGNCSVTWNTHYVGSNPAISLVAQNPYCWRAYGRMYYYPTSAKCPAGGSVTGYGYFQPYVVGSQVVLLGYSGCPGSYITTYIQDINGLTAAYNFYF